MKIGFNALVTPILEYVCQVCNPYLAEYVTRILLGSEKVCPEKAYWAKLDHPGTPEEVSF